MSVAGKQLTSAALEPLLTKAEAAAALNVPARFVERLVSERRVRFVRVGRYIRIPTSAIKELLESGAVEPAVRRTWG